MLKGTLLMGDSQLQVQIKRRLIAQRDTARAELDKLRGFVRMALDELGVPQPEYPAPITNAVEFLREGLSNE